MSQEMFSVALRIRHPGLDPDEITRELGLIPEHSWKAGDIRPEARGGSSQNRYVESYWIAPVRFSAGLAMPETPEGTIALAATLLKRRKDFWQRLHSGGGRAELLVSLSGYAANLELSSETLSLLNGIGLSISFEAENLEAAVA
jgi:hypothetical protein